MRVSRLPYEQLPEATRRALADRIGEGCARVDMATGDSSALASLFTLRDGGKVFVKGLPADHERVGELAVEAKINPFLPAFAPKLLWRESAGGWTLLGFEGLTVPPWADFTAGSGHLEPAAAVVRELSTRPCPDIGLMTVWDRWGSYCAPDDEPLLTGDALVHADPAATNFLIGEGRAWLVDWAWAARGPAWADAVLWGFRLVLDGRQTPEQAAGWAATVPAFAHAPRRGVRVLSEAEARSWEDWKEYGTAGLEGAVTAARAWADFWAAR
ncbi:aminoglycoside phosphotransferase [Streptomyces sp. NPDC059092]|uniref:aminoglycoside phosphotransferase n=1 Tax=Streptomyces sp. NPDC059092 TaxID=3346725 RepID=UPI0036C0D62C